MSIRVVVDTNVLVSAFLTKNPLSPTARIYRSILAGEVIPLISDEIIDEYKDVLHRAKFKFNPDDVDAAIAYIELIGEYLFPVDSDEDFIDLEDKVFYCTALAGEAYLVTGNIKHYPQSAIVITPSEFCEIHGL